MPCLHMHVCMYTHFSANTLNFIFIVPHQTDRHGKLFIEEDTKLSIEEQPARTEVI